MIGFLYGQTEYNLLSNMIKLDDYILEAQKEGYKFLSITDCNMHGYYKFYNKCLKNDIKPIIGLQIEVESFDDEKNYLIAYALNDLGLSNLFKISTLQKDEGVLKITDLTNYQDNLLFISTGLDFIIDRLYKQNRIDESLKVITYCKKNLKNFTLGYSLQNFKDSSYKTRMYNHLKNDYKFLPLFKTLYKSADDYNTYKIFSTLQNKYFNEENLYYFPTNNDITYGCSFPQLFQNLELFVNSVTYHIQNTRLKLPTYPKTFGVSSLDFLKNMCYNGLEKRMMVEKYINKEQYIKRLDYEIEVINNMDYCDYFLIVWDFVKYAKNNKIMVGPGRGSAAGSLVSYCLGITSVDPIKYDLFFERFLNKDRISMPDIDMDFPDDRRDEVISYVKDTYGKKHVCNITAFTTFQIKSSLRDIARVLNISSARVSEVIKLAINYDTNTLLQMFKDNEEIYNLISIASTIEGLPRHISTHAAGIILSSVNLDDIVALQPGLNNLYQSQLEAHDLEDMGLLKIDFLGIRNLSLINEVVKQIDGLNNINIYKIPLDDKATYNMLKKADTLGIFQLESSGIKNVLKKLQPSCFEDIVAVLALYRPGPMESIDTYIQRKNGMKFSYIHKDLEPILSQTYGIILYQEQIMKIALKFANYSLAQADLLRRAISKKQNDVLVSLREKFVKSSVLNGYLESDANLIYDYIVKFANYGFNRAHSVSYALVSYVMAYLKANYFNIFIQKLLDNVIGSSQSTVSYIEYAMNNNVTVCPPDINISENKYCLFENKIYMPFLSIYGIGQAVSNQIIEARELGDFKSFDDFKARVNIGSKTTELLVYAGCFDDFNVSKKQLIDKSDDAISIIDKFLQDLKEVKDYDESYLRDMEFKMLGLNLKYDLFNNIDFLNKKYNASLLKGHKILDRVTFIAYFNEVKIIKTKKQEDMMVGNIRHMKAIVDIVMFPQTFKDNTLPLLNKLYVINGKISRNKMDKIQIEIYNYKVI